MLLLGELGRIGEQQPRPKLAAGEDTAPVPLERKQQVNPHSAHAPFARPSRRFGDVLFQGTRLCLCTGAFVLPYFFGATGIDPIQKEQGASVIERTDEAA